MMHASAAHTNGLRDGSGGRDGTAIDSGAALVFGTSFVIVGDETGGGGRESFCGACPADQACVATARSTTVRARFGAKGRSATARSAADW